MKKKFNWSLIAVVALLGYLLVSLGGRLLSAPRDEAHAAVEKGAVLLDVRSPEEFAEGHLPGAINIPVGELASRMAELPKKDAGIVVYCRSGARSARATGILHEHGLTQIVDLGPMSAW